MEKEALRLFKVIYSDKTIGNRYDRFETQSHPYPKCEELRECLKTMGCTDFDIVDAKVWEQQRLTCM